MLHVAGIGKPHPGQVCQPGGLIGHALANHGQVEALLPGEGLVVEFLGELSLPGEAEHLIDQPALVGQILFQSAQQVVLLEHPLHPELDCGEVGQALPHPIHRIGKGVAFLLCRRQRPEDHQHPHVIGRDGDPIKSLSQGGFHGAAGVLRQGSQQLGWEGFLLEQRLPRLIGINHLVPIQQQYRFRKTAKGLVQVRSHGIHSINSLQNRISIPQRDAEFSATSVAKTGRERKNFVEKGRAPRANGKNAEKCLFP